MTYQNSGSEDSQSQTLVHIMDDLDPLESEESQTSSMPHPLLESPQNVKADMDDLSVERSLQLQVKHTNF